MDKAKLERQIRQLPKSNRIGTSQESYTLKTAEPSKDEPMIKETGAPSDNKPESTMPEISQRKEEKAVSPATSPSSSMETEPPILPNAEGLSREDLMKMLSMMMNSNGFVPYAKKPKKRKNQITIYLTDEELSLLDSKVSSDFKTRSDVIAHLLLK